MRFFLFLFFCSVFAFSQEKFTLSGVVKAEESNETIIDAIIYFYETNQQVSTNSYGFFSINLPAGTHNYEVIKSGYQQFASTIEIDSDLRIEIEIDKSEKTQLKEVVIKKNSGKIDLKKPELSSHSLEIEQVKKMPVLLGEADVLKSRTFLPGVVNGGEISSGINVRGGAVDQNLIQIDEATVFNSSHLFGFFSVFNSDAIKDLKLYKGGIPARYGGRVSSVLDIFQRDGNNKEFHLNGGVGLLSSRLLAEGPLKKEKSSFLVFRRYSRSDF